MTEINPSSNIYNVFIIFQLSIKFSSSDETYRVKRFLENKNFERANLCVPINFNFNHFTDILANFRENKNLCFKIPVEVTWISSVSKTNFVPELLEIYQFHVAGNTTLLLRVKIDGEHGR